MSRGRTAGSIFWGLILVAIGALFLARNLGYSIPIWQGLARYWPVLIIIWGGVKLIDYVQSRRRGDERSLFSGGEVALLIVVILAGSAITTAANMNPDLSSFLEIADIDLWEITGNNYDYMEHYEVDAVPGAIIEIINRYGGVEVRPADVDRIIVDVQKTVVASTQEEADRLSSEFMFSIRAESPGYRVISNLNRDENQVRGRRFKTSLTIRVPKQSALRIDNRNGRVSVADLMGDQEINNGFGEVEVRGIVGAVELENRNGDVTVEDITGPATLHNGFANTTARNIGGTLEIDTRNGSVDVSDVMGDATISNSFASVTASNIKGQLNVTGRNNSVDLEQIEGDVTVENSFANVSIREPRAAVTVRNRNGDVLISLEQVPTRDISVSTEFSNITLELPSASAFRIDARTRFGEINSDFGLGVSSDDPERSVNDSVGEGGPNLRIDTRNGDIRINKRG